MVDRRARDTILPDAATCRGTSPIVSKRLAIVQSNYIPWKGYFDLIASVDEFVLYDDAQYTVRDWRNRNRIKTRHGLKWLTIPVTAGARSRPIRDVDVADGGWAETHWQTIAHAYASAPHFASIRAWLEPLFRNCQATRLSDINRSFLEAVATALDIRTPLRWSWEYGGSGARTTRLVEICVRAGATVYVSGPSARNYIEPERFAEAGVALEYFNYDGYPEYEQLYPPFEHGVSVIDLLCHAGRESRRFLERH